MIARDGENKNQASLPPQAAASKNPVRADTSLSGFAGPTSLNSAAADRTSNSTIISESFKEALATFGFAIQRELGRGGMGVTYLAKNISMDRLEVLKVLNENLINNPEAHDRFQREIRSVGKLNHRAIVIPYQDFLIGKSKVLAMEYIAGEDLHKIIYKQYQRGKAIPIALACKFATQIALGLQHAHEKGMVHRDIKPSNIMIYKSDGEFEAKILDFGLARFTSEKESEGLTQEGQMLGTLEYIAPEQMMNAAKADIRADLYSLGCTFYQMLVGRPPFKGTNAELMAAHMHRTPQSISSLRPDVSPQLVAIVEKMMAKKVDARFQAPREIVNALGALSLPPNAGPSTPFVPPIASSGDRPISPAPNNAAHGYRPITKRSKHTSVVYAITAISLIVFSSLAFAIRGSLSTPRLPDTQSKNVSSSVATRPVGPTFEEASIHLPNHPSSERIAVAKNDNDVDSSPLLPLPTIQESPPPNDAESLSTSPLPDRNPSSEPISMVSSSNPMAAEPIASDTSDATKKANVREWKQLSGKPFLATFVEFDELTQAVKLREPQTGKEASVPIDTLDEASRGFVRILQDRKQCEMVFAHLDDLLQTPQNSIASMKDLAKRFPNSPYASAWGGVAIAAGENELPDATRQFEDAIRRCSAGDAARYKQTVSSVFNNRGVCNVKQGNGAGAAMFFAKAIEATKRPSPVLIHNARYLLNYPANNRNGIKLDMRDRNKLSAALGKVPAELMKNSLPGGWFYSLDFDAPTLPEGEFFEEDENDSIASMANQLNDVQALEKKFSLRDPWCLECDGKGRVQCSTCRGKGVADGLPALFPTGRTVNGQPEMIRKPTTVPCRVCSGSKVLPCKACVDGKH